MVRGRRQWDGMCLVQRYTISLNPNSWFFFRAAYLKMLNTKMCSELSIYRENIQLLLMDLSEY